MSEKKGKGCLIGIVVFIVLIIFSVVLFLSVKSAINPVPSVKENSLLVINLKGEIPEYTEKNTISDFLKPKELTYGDLYKVIKRAKVDKKIKGIALLVSTPGIGLAKVEEISELLKDFKKSGKFVYTYIDISAEYGYWLSLPSNKIFMPETGYLEINGFRIGNMYLKDLLSKLGIEAEVVNIGKYKSYGDIFKRTKMSDADKEQLTDLLDDIFNRFVNDISKWRKIKREDVLSIIDRGITIPAEALKCKLIDGLCYENEFFGKIKSLLGVRKLHKISAMKYLKSISSFDFSRNKVAVIFINGGIGFGKSGYSPLMGKVVGSDDIIKIIRKVKKNRSIKGVILRVNSPGGSAIGSDLIWKEVKDLSEVKPVIASMSDYAASGGYYISVACQKIVAEPLTITGSIGVVSVLFNLEKLYKKLGINVEVLKKGKWADFPSTRRALTKEEWDRYRKESESFYKIFVNRVCEGRSKTFDEIDSIARGRVWSGKRALKIGLVDRLGGLDTAINLMKRELHISPEEEVSLIFYPRKKKLFDLITENLETAEKVIIGCSSPENILIKRIIDFFHKEPFLYLMERKIQIQ